jgi:hypothetical protein
LRFVAAVSRESNAGAFPPFCCFHPLIIYLFIRRLLIIQEEAVGDPVIQDNCDEKATYCLNKAISIFFLFLFFFPSGAFGAEDFCQKVSLVKFTIHLFKSSSGEIWQNISGSIFIQGFLKDDNLACVET